jgi:hypothetical protein
MRFYFNGAPSEWQSRCCNQSRFDDTYWADDLQDFVAVTPLKTFSNFLQFAFAADKERHSRR